jgi:hypothetical protein
VSASRHLRLAVEPPGKRSPRDKLRRQLSPTVPITQCTLDKTALASPFAALPGLTAAVARLRCPFASDTADRMNQRRYSPKANEITDDEQNRNSPSELPTWFVTTNHASAIKPPTTRSRLNTNTSARSDITQLNSLPFHQRQRDPKNSVSSSSEPSNSSNASSRYELK